MWFALFHKNAEDITQTGGSVCSPDGCIGILIDVSYFKHRTNQGHHLGLSNPYKERSCKCNLQVSHRMGYGAANASDGTNLKIV